jgi:cytochrome c peroxidase
LTKRLIHLVLAGALAALPCRAEPSSHSSLVELGKKLFFDPELSADGKVSCATCHQPSKAFTDGRAVAVGAGGKPGTRNTPSLLGSAKSASLFWDGRRQSLRELIADPLTNPNEHGLADRAAAVAAVEGHPPFERIAEAIAAYVETLDDQADAPFDRYFYQGNQTALDEAARRGFELFRGRAGCTACHSIGTKQASFTDGDFHSGILEADVSARLPELTQLVSATLPGSRGVLISSRHDVAELGRFVATLDPRDIGKFRTPSLRNVSLTGPYLHDGSAITLEEAVAREIYASGVRATGQLHVTPSEARDLIEFLKALTSDSLRRGTL